MNEAANLPPLRVAIVDDEAPARSRLRDVLSDCALKLPLVIAGEASNGREALALLEGCDADVVLLDVRMPEMDGIEVAQHLLKLADPPAVIFTTAYDEFALNAFEVHAVDYLLKPVRGSRLLDALARVRTMVPPRAGALMELKGGARTHVSVSERGRIHLVPVQEIVYLKAELKYVTARTAAREYLLEESLTKLEQEFLGRFARIHRNCLVAKDAIRGFERVAEPGGEGHWVVLLNGLEEKLAVSRRQQQIVRDFSR